MPTLDIVRNRLKRDSKRRRCQITHPVHGDECKHVATHRLTKDWAIRVCPYHAKICEANGFEPVLLPLENLMLGDGEQVGGVV